MSIYFITGTAGSGKTTLLRILKEKLPKTSFVVYDFDENGIPVYPDKLWRKNTTNYWLEHANKNNTERKNTVIIGVTVPSEVFQSFSYDKTSKVFFCLIRADDTVVEKRLKDRQWGDKIIEDSINWQRHLEREVIPLPNNLLVESRDDVEARTVADIVMNWVALHDEFKK